MPAWTGNPKNPAPNPVQADESRSEKRIEQDRSYPIRRDTDKEKNFTITFKDVDQVIFDHLEKMQLSVVDEGNSVKVPIIYGSPEKWVAARRDGYLRDRQGKLQLPAMIFRRSSSENDDNIEIFNRYVQYPVIRRHSEKNKYTQFAILTGKNTPVHEVFNITMADHMVFTYSFIVWTEYNIQMNKIIEKIKFNTKDYWGSPRGFRFRTKAEGFTHTIELTTDDDRAVKTEFNLIVNGYILPETYQLLDRQYPTTEKLFTPKKIIMGTEVVTSDIGMPQDPNASKWRSQSYPNIERGTEPTAPNATWIDGPVVTLPVSAISTLRNVSITTTTTGFDVTSTSTPPIMWQAPPDFPNSPGQEGWITPPFLR